MIIRAAGLGILLWLAIAVAMRFLGQRYFMPGEAYFLGMAAALFVAMPIVTFAGIRFLKAQRGDEAEAAIAMAFPGMLLNTFVVREFTTLFPDIDFTLDSTFAALMLFAYAVMIFTGLMMTRIAPQDERL
jgi:hypothetical protein